MKRMAMVLVAVMAGASLYGCANQGKMAAMNGGSDQRADAIKARKDELMHAIENSVVTCKGKDQCEKAFSLAKVYIKENSDMKIQTSDDTIITTYNPTRSGLVSMSAMKIPDVGDLSSIELTVNCPGINAIEKGGSDLNFRMFELCARLSILHYEEFKKYVSEKMQ